MDINNIVSSIIFGGSSGGGGGGPVGPIYWNVIQGKPKLAWDNTTEEYTINNTMYLKDIIGDNIDTGIADFKIDNLSYVEVVEDAKIVNLTSPTNEEIDALFDDLEGEDPVANDYATKTELATALENFKTQPATFSSKSISATTNIISNLTVNSFDEGTIVNAMDFTTNTVNYYAWKMGLNSYAYTNTLEGRGVPVFRKNEHGEMVQQTQLGNINTTTNKLSWSAGSETVTCDRWATADEAIAVSPWDTSKIPSLACLYGLGQYFLSLLTSGRAILSVETMPENPLPNTIYYVGNASPYAVILVTTDLQQLPLGSSELDLTEYLKKTEASTTYRTINDSYTKVEVDNKLLLKADVATTYTKTEVDNLLNAKADSSNVYAKTEVDTELAKKVDKTAIKTSITSSLTNNDLVGGLALFNKINDLAYSKSGNMISLADGLKIYIQTGVTVASSGTQTKDFSTPFPNTCYAVIAVPSQPGYGANAVLHSSVVSKSQYKISQANGVANMGATIIAFGN